MKPLKPGAWFPDTREVEGHHCSALGACAPGRSGHGSLRRRSVLSARALVSCLALAVLTAVCVVRPAAAAGTRSAAGPRNEIDVSMRDFKLRVSRSTVPAGHVVIRVHNQGPSTHEINVDRTDLASGALPLKADGLTVDEESKSLHRIDSIEQLNLGETGDLPLNLKPGRYVLYCNLEGHYLGGMHVGFEVRASDARSAR